MKRTAWPVIVVVSAAGLAAAVAPGAVARTRAATRPATDARPPINTLWVSNFGANDLLEFAPTARGNVAPVRTIGGSATGLYDPTGIAIGADGKVWTTTATPPYTIAGFQPLATGNVAPAVAITGAKTGLDEPCGLALAQNGDIWVVNAGSNSIEEFAPTAHGDATPIRTISGANTKLTNAGGGAPVGIAVSPDSKHVWVTEDFRAGQPSTLPVPVVYEFAGTAKGNVKPVATITGSKTKLDSPYGVAVGIAGTSPVVSNVNAGGVMSVLGFGAGAHGNAAPKREITGSKTGLSLPSLIAMDATGNVWVPNQSANLPPFTPINTVTRFAAAQTGNVAPTAVISGALTTLNRPVGVAVYALPPGPLRSVKAHASTKKLTIRWKAPVDTGGGVLGYVVRRARRQHGPWTIVATVTKKSYTKKHPRKAYFYDVEAFNNKGYSPATKATKIPR